MKKKELIFLFACIIIFILYAGVILKLNNYAINDDSYITFRYSANLGSGYGAVFNKGERVEGYSSLLWVIIMALVKLFGGDMKVWSILLGLLIYAGIIIYLYLKIIEISKEQKTKILWAVISVLILIFNYRFVRWSVEGNEFSLYVLLVLLYYETFSRFLKDFSGRFYILTIILSGLFILLRPEAPIYIILSGMISLSYYFKNKTKDLLIKILWFYLPVIIIYFIFILWRRLYYGYWLPNTFYCKVEVGTDYLYRGYLYFISAMKLTRWWLMFIPIIILLFYKKLVLNNVYQLLLWIITVFVLSLYYIWVGGDLYKERLILPVFPLLLLSSVQLLQSVKKFNRYHINIICFLLIGIYIINFRNFADNMKNYHSFKAKNISSWEFAGKWLKKEFNKDTYISSCAVGIIPYYSGMKTLDMLGLCDSYIAHMKPANKNNIPGHNKYNSQYVISKNTDLILTHYDNTDRYGLFGDPNFRNNYVLLGLLNNNDISELPPVYIFQDKQEILISGEDNIIDEFRSKGYTYGIFKRKEFNFGLIYYFAPYARMPLDNGIELIRDKRNPSGYSVRINHGAKVFIQKINLPMSEVLKVKLKIKIADNPQKINIQISSDNTIYNDNINISDVKNEDIEIILSNIAKGEYKISIENLSNDGYSILQNVRIFR